MLDNETIKALHRAFRKSPRGFVVVDSGRPKFAVLDYKTYTALSHKQQEQIERKVERQASGTVLVTGGAGYIGSHTVRLMEKLGLEAVVYDNLSTGQLENVRDSELIEADLLDERALDEIFSEHDFDAVIHFAAVTEVEESVSDPAKYFKNNVVGGINLLEAMRKHGVDKLIFSSTCAVYGTPAYLPVNEDAPYMPESPYGASKMMFEEILNWYEQAYGINSISLRYFNAAGAWPEEDLGHRTERNPLLVPRVLNVAAGREEEIRVFGQDYDTADGTAIRDYIHVLDLAEAHVAAVDRLRETNGAYFYNLGTGRGSTVLEVIDKAVEVTGRMVPMSVTERRPGDPEKLWADTKRANQDLGWQARRGLEEIVRDAWQWVQTGNNKQ